jgi:glycosyltransferase involved in cell wall biosynthesis
VAVERITIAIPYHAGLAYLERAIASALAQSRPPATIIVSDDSDSPEEAAQLVAGLANARVRHVSAAHGAGMVANWNRCLELAETELVTLLHADDELLPEYCARMEDAAAVHPKSAALFCAAKIIDGAGRPRFSLPDWIKTWLVPIGEGPILLAGERGLRLLLHGNFVMCPTLCWRRAILGERRFVPRWKQVQDLELLCRLLLEGETLVGIRHEIYAYRRHDASATALQSENLLRFEEEIALYDVLAESTLARGWRRAARAARGKRIIRLHLLFLIALDLVKLHLRRIPAKLKLLGVGRLATR